MRTLYALLLLLLPALVQGQTLVGDSFRLNTGPCTIRSGSGVPSTSLGVVCDTYFRTDVYSIYLKTGASTWSVLYHAGGTDVAVADGGTGLSSYTTGDLVYASAATTLAGRAAVASGSVLASAGVSTAPVWSATPSVTTLTGTTSVVSPLFTNTSAAQITTSSGNLTVAPAGDIVFNPTGNDLLPTTGYDLNIGSLTTKYLTLHAAELWVETLVAQNTIATIGGRIIVSPTTTLSADFGSGGTTITVKHNQIANGDRLYMEADGKVEFMAVTSGAGGSAGAYTYTVTRNLDGSGANDWYAGDAVVNTGTTGDGYIDLYSVSGVNSGSTVGPTIVGNVRTGTTYSNIAPRWAIGNMNGLYGYSADTYGAAFGDFTNSYLTIDATNGIRMIGDAGTMFSMDTAGNATFAGRLTLGTGRNILSNTEFLRGRGAGDSYNGYWGGSAATGDPSAPYACTTSCTQRATHGSGWSWYGADETTAAATLTVGADPSAAQKPLGGNSVYFYPTGTPANATTGRIAGPVLPVDEDLTYEYSVYVGMSGGWTTTARIFWFGVDGGDGGDQPDLISDVAGSTTCTTGTFGPDLGTWCRAGGIFTPPAGARLAQLAVLATYDGGDATPITIITRPFFAQAQVGQTSFTPWGPGGQSLITGDMLSTDLVIANTLRSSGATALGTGTGYWLDASSTPTFRVGNPAGNRISWDGTDLTLVSANTTMDSSGLAITPAAVESPSRAFRFEVANGVLGAFGYDDATFTTRGMNLNAEWTGTGNRTVGVGMTAENSPSSGGTAKFASVSALSNGSTGDVAFSASDRVVMQGTMWVYLNDATTTSIPFMRGNGNYLVMNSRSNANGGTLYLQQDVLGDVVMGVGGGTTRINTSLQLVGLASCTLQVNGSGLVGCVSDRAAKTDIKSWTPGLDAISKLRPVSYRWKEGDRDTHIGFIAQEVATVLPNAVRRQEWNGGSLTLDDRTILAALVNAVQELQRKQR